MKKWVSEIAYEEFELAVFEKLRVEFLPLSIRVEGTEAGRIHEVLGRHSLVARQLDAAAYRPGVPRPFLIADAKRHNRKIDVKEAEAFLGMVDDVGAEIGLLVAPCGFTDGAQRRASAGSSYVRIMTVEDALTFRWLPVARLVYPYDWIFREQLALAIRRLNEGGPAAVLIDALETIAFEEWDAFVLFALKHHPSEAVEFLNAVAMLHEDDGWRYNAVRHLVECGRLEHHIAAHLREHETDQDTRELLVCTG